MKNFAFSLFTLAFVASVGVVSAQEESKPKAAADSKISDVEIVINASKGAI